MPEFKPYYHQKKKKKEEETLPSPAPRTVWAYQMLNKYLSNVLKKYLSKNNKHMLGGVGKDIQLLTMLI
jgi:hypothetical protein